MTALDALPLTEVEAVFLDVGGTVTAMDFARIAAELASRGAPCAPEQLERAEAAARPIVSARLAERRTLEDRDSFAFFLRTMFERLPPGAGVDPALAAEVAPRLFAPGESGLLWTWVLPGVREGLAALRALGLPIVAVSNSDGTARAGLERAGLAASFDGVVDSHEVGVAKPDPRIFDHALELAGVERPRALHVGDMYFADVVGARRAELAVVLLDPHGDWDAPDCPTARDLPEVAAALARARGDR